MLYNLPIFVLHNIVFNVLSDNKKCFFYKCPHTICTWSHIEYFLDNAPYKFIFITVWVCSGEVKVS